MSNILVSGIQKVGEVIKYAWVHAGTFILFTMIIIPNNISLNKIVVMYIDLCDELNAC